MRRHAALPLLLVATRVAACPTCAGSTHSVNVWPIVGAFILVPPLIALAVLYALRKELGTSSAGAPSEGRVLPFARRA